MIPKHTFDTFLIGSSLVGIEDGLATIGTTQPFAKDWIENRLSAQIGRALRVERVRCEVVEATK